MTTLNRLTPLRVKNEKRPGRHSDGGNLYLVVAPKTLSKTWSFLYRAPGTGRQREAGFGPIGALTMKQARDRAQEGRALLAQGKDPLEVWREAKRAARPMITFGEAAKEHFSKKFREWKNQRSGRGEETILDNHAAKLTALPIDAIDTAIVLSVLKPIWTAKPVTAQRLRARIEQILNAGYVMAQIDKANPARWRGHLDHVLARAPKVQHYASLPYADLPDFVAQLRQMDTVYAAPLEFTILTATRANEALGARWDEIELDARMWKIPAARMKGGRDHRVPLSGRAVEILRQMKKARPEDQLVFRGAYAPLNGKGLQRLVKGMGYDVTVHGFRSSFRTWVSEKTPTPWAVAEAALAHLVGDATSQAYERTDHFEARVPLMTAWAAYLDGHHENVVPFQKVEAS
jgi:integrase